MKHPNLISLLIALLALPTLVSCRHDEMVMPTEYERVPVEEGDSPVKGLYLVNEGNMGSNKCSLDYLDLTTGIYSRNIYAERNPNVIKELGDVGNDIGIYGSKLYVVVNCSHKVEVLDAHTGVRIGSIDIPNCRYVRFHGGDAYVSSYVGPVLVDPSAPKGAVCRIDTLSLKITGRVTVGYQPEEMEIVDDMMYVANSGGYRAPDYDNTVSVIDLKQFAQVRLVPVAINLHRIRKDDYGRLWVNSRGNHEDIPSRLYMLSEGRAGMNVSGRIDVNCSNFAIHGDRLYYYAAGKDVAGAGGDVTYGIIDVRSGEVVADSFITDGTEKEIKMPYGIAVNPANGDIYVTDARNYVSSGRLYCLSPEGKKRWSVRTGDIPAAIAFLTEQDNTSDN